MFQVSTSASHQELAQHKRLYTCSEQEFAPELPAPLPTRGALPSPLHECSGGEGFPIPGKPQLPPIQPQNNSWAGCQPPASTLQPSPGRTRQYQRSSGLLCWDRGGGRWRPPHYHGLTPRLCFLQPCLSAGSACSQVSARQKQESSLLGSFPPFFVKNNPQKFKISKQLPASRTPCYSTGKNFIEPTYIFCSP